MATFIKLNSSTDTIVDTQKVTAGYFSNGSGKLLGSALHSASVAATNETYYYGITNSEDADATTQFTVAYGHYAGSGSVTDSDDIKGATQAIYSQWASTLLPENEITGGFIISSPGSNSAVTSGKDEDIYILVARRSLFKERFNKGNWTLQFSGSNTANNAVQTLVLTDDSKTTTPTATPAGPRYNIVTGSDGNLHSTDSSSAARNFGFFYPEVGALVFSVAEMSRSIQGAAAITSSAITYKGATNNGFAPGTGNDADYKNGLKFINALKCGNSANTYIQARSEEDQTSVSYFCRATANQMNFSNNPTFVSGSANEIRQSTLRGNPTVFITGVGLYNTSGQLVAISKLSTPLKKNFSSEATIKVKLTY